MSKWEMQKQVLKESGKFQAFENFLYSKQCELKRDLTEEEEEKLAEIVLNTSNNNLIIGSK